MINLRAYHTSLLLGLILLVQLAIVSSAPFDEPKSDEPDIPVLQHFTKNRPKRVSVRRPSRKSGRTKSSDSEPGADKSSTDIGSMSPEPSVISQEPVTPEDTPHHPHSSHARRPFVRSASNTLEFKSEKYQNHNQHRRTVSCEVYPNLGEHTEHSMSNKSAPATPVKNEVPIFRSESIASIKSESHESPAKNSQSKPPTSSNVKSTPIQPNVIFQIQPSGTYGGASDTKQSGSTTMRSSFSDKKYILAIFLTVGGVVIIALFVFISILVYNRQKRNPVIYQLNTFFS